MGNIKLIKSNLSVVIFLLFASCQEVQTNSTNKVAIKTIDSTMQEPKIADSTKLKQSHTENKFDTSKMSIEDRIKKLIEISTLKKFESSRRELIEQGSQYQYHG